MKSWVWQVAFATIFEFLVCYMTNIPGRCLRRSRLSVAHPGEANGDRQTAQMRAPVPLLVSLEGAAFAFCILAVVKDG